MFQAIMECDDHNSCEEEVQLAPETDDGTAVVSYVPLVELQVLPHPFVSLQNEVTVQVIDILPHC